MVNSHNVEIYTFNFSDQPLNILAKLVDNETEICGGGDCCERVDIEWWQRDPA